MQMKTNGHQLTATQNQYDDCIHKLVDLMKYITTAKVINIYSQELIQIYRD